jgi:phospholipid transport system substrate-binding protein
MHSLGKLRRTLMRLWVMALALSLALASGALAGRPTDEVKSLIDEVLRILQHQASQSPDQKRQRLGLIEKATTRRIDYREMARRSLGPAWNTLNRSQQDEFVHLFSELLKSSYAGKLDEFAQARVVYQSEENSEETAEVRVLILRQNDKIPVIFRLLHEPEGWMIYDLVIEGVSLVANYRSQFSRIIEGASYKALVRCLQTKLQADSENMGAEAREGDED